MFDRIKNAAKSAYSTTQKYAESLDSVYVGAAVVLGIAGLTGYAIGKGQRDKQ